MLFTFRAEKNLLPASVVNQVTTPRPLEVEEQQCFKLGRKQLRELKEQVTDELLPRAFSIRRDTRVWIDAVNGWLVIDAAAQELADDVRGLLVKSIDPLPLASVRVALSPVAAMTDWLLSGGAPALWSDPPTHCAQASFTARLASSQAARHSLCGVALLH